MGDGTKRVLITAALPYANGEIHLGHISGCYLGADIRARFERMCGSEVLFLSGSDCYGVAIFMKATQEHISPEECANKYHKLNSDILEQMCISFDHFSSTLNSFHIDIAQQFFNNLIYNNMVMCYKSHHLYSPEKDMFFADRHVVGICPYCGYDKARGDECTKCARNYEPEQLINPRDVFTKSVLILKQTLHWFLLIEKAKQMLASYLDNLVFIPDHFRSVLFNILSESNSRCITRDLSWGVPIYNCAVSKDINLDSKVLYVWFDALVGYVSIAKEWASMYTNNQDSWKDYWLDEKTEYLAFMGKDSVMFHAIVFPMMLFYQDTKYKVIDTIIAREFYLLNGKKFSKGDGNYISTRKLLEWFPVDIIRYYLAYSSPEGKDASFSFENFVEEVNATLCNNIGNFVNRITTFWNQHFYIEDFVSSVLNRSNIEVVDFIVSKCKEEYCRSSTRMVVHYIKQLGDFGNKLFTTAKVWEIVKEDPVQARQHLKDCFYCLDKIVLLSSAIMPNFARQMSNVMVRAANFEYTWDNWAQDDMSSVISIKNSGVVFEKLCYNQIMKIFS